MPAQRNVLKEKDEGTLEKLPLTYAQLCILDHMRLVREAKRIAYESVTLGGNRHLRPGFLETERNRSKLTAVLSTLGVVATRVAPGFMFNLVTRSYRQAGCEVLGLGYHTVVVARGEDEVMKVHHRTLDMPDEHRAEYIDRLYRKQQVLIDHFPAAMIVRQEFRVEPWPLDPSRTTVVSIQPRVRGARITERAIVQDKKILDLCSQMYKNAEALPDIVGKVNMIRPVGEPDPVIIDTIPVEKSDPTDWAAYRSARKILWGPESMEPIE